MSWDAMSGVPLSRFSGIKKPNDAGNFDLMDLMM